MPAPNDKKGKKSGKLKKPGHNNAADAVMKRLLKSYDQCCQFTNSQMFPGIKAAIRGCIENSSVLTKFILHTPDPLIPDAPPILIEPLLAAIRHDRYVAIKYLYIWDYPMSYENVASLALMMEKPFYQIRQLELMDCLLTADKVERLVRPFHLSLSLTHVMLDYNEFGDEGCLMLCSGLAGTSSVLSLSLCYCRLGVVSGKYLGQVVASTAIHELYLDGNDLECEGAMELVQRLADKAQSEAFEREEEARRKAEEKAREEEAKKAGRYSPYMSTMASSGASDRSLSPPGKKKKKKGKKKKKKGPPPPPRVGPWITKLHLADNGIDCHGKGANFAPIICLRLISTLVVHSECFEELDLEDNQVGDLAARELLEALEKRGEAKLPPMKVRTTHRLNADTFQGILKLGSGLKKKKKKGKKKKKK